MNINCNTLLLENLSYPPCSLTKLNLTTWQVIFLQFTVKNVVRCGDIIIIIIIIIIYILNLIANSFHSHFYFCTLQSLVKFLPIMGSAIVLIFFLTISLLNPSDSWSLTGILQQSTKDRNSNSPPGARLLDRRFTRFENLFNDDNNASLYLPRFDLGRRNDEVSTTTLPPATNNTDGRSLDLNVLLGSSSSSSSESGESQEGRIVNDRPTKMDIQGFIPIISLAKPQQPVQIPKPQFPYSGIESSSFQQNHHVYPNPMMEQGKSNAFGGIHAAIQNLAAPFKLRRRGQEMIPGQDCLCVPFYMCSKGYLETTAKNSISSSSFTPATSPSKEYYEQQLAAAQSEIASSIPEQFNPFTQGSHPITTQTQPIYQGNQASNHGQQSYDSANLPLDERSVDGQDQGRSTHFPSNGTEVSFFLFNYISPLIFYYYRTKYRTINSF